MELGRIGSLLRWWGCKRVSGRRGGGFKCTSREYMHETDVDGGVG